MIELDIKLLLLVLKFYFSAYFQIISFPNFQVRNFKHLNIEHYQSDEKIPPFFLSFGRIDNECSIGF